MTYGTLAEPLLSIHEPCPTCGSEIACVLPSALHDLLALGLSAADRARELEMRRTMRHVYCGDCGFEGTAWRREHP